MHAELASAAETGWDPTARWMKEPLAGGTNNTESRLRTPNVRGTLPVDLNSILSRDVSQACRAAS